MIAIVFVSFVNCAAIYFPSISPQIFVWSNYDVQFPQNVFSSPPGSHSFWVISCRVLPPTSNCKFLPNTFNFIFIMSELSVVYLVFLSFINAASICNILALSIIWCVFSWFLGANLFRFVLNILVSSAFKSHPSILHS